MPQGISCNLFFQHLQENGCFCHGALILLQEFVFSFLMKRSYFSIRAAKWRIPVAAWFSAFPLSSSPSLGQVFSTPCCTQAWLNQRQVKIFCYTFLVWEVIILLYLCYRFHLINLQHNKKSKLHRRMIYATQGRFWVKCSYIFIYK